MVHGSIETNNWYSTPATMRILAFASTWPTKWMHGSCYSGPRVNLCKLCVSRSSCGWSVEIDGVVSEDGLTAQQILKGVGQFKRQNLPTVQIIDVKQMATSEGEGETRRFIPSNSYRVTFAGTALPDFLLIDGVLRLPVRMFYPRVMNCTNCRKLGHTKAFCYNKTVCGKCGEKHRDEQCQKESNKCLLCGGAPHETQSCPKYRERSSKLELELKKRSKRSFAEIVKLAIATTKVENPYEVLSVEEAEQDPVGKESTMNSAGKSQTRKKKPNSKLRKTGEASKDTHLLSEKEDSKGTFTPVGSKRKRKGTTNTDSTDPQKEEAKFDAIQIPFSIIVELILSTVCCRKCWNH